MKSSYVLAMACVIPLTGCGLMKKSKHNKWTGKKTEVKYDISGLDESRFGKGKNPVAVLVVSERSDSNSMSTCTSFAIGDRLVMTNHHCIESSNEGMYAAPDAIRLYFKAPGQAVAREVRIEEIVGQERVDTDVYSKRFTAVESDRDWAILRTKESIADFGTLSLNIREPTESFYSGNETLETLRINPPDSGARETKWTFDIAKATVESSNALNDSTAQMLTTDLQEECKDNNEDEADCAKIAVTKSELYSELVNLDSLVFDSLVRGGNSGSPVVNKNGVVVGILHAGFFNRDGSESESSLMVAQILHSMASQLLGMDGIRLIK